MQELPGKLREKLNNRKDSNSLRKLVIHEDMVDLVSNDYLGFARAEDLYKQSNKFLEDQQVLKTGSTGSRLLSGNNRLLEVAEEQVAQFHNSESALIFNSGYDANLGFFASVPVRGDLILFDEYAHASIRDGISMSQAKSYKFRHNDLSHLKELIERHKIQIKDQKGIIYVVTESVFSMDGDSPDLVSLVKMCGDYDCMLIIDEAHAAGIFGPNGGGLITQYQLESKVFARIVTFGKALGVHGAAVLGSAELKEYLINFARSLIYTTALSPHSSASIMMAYKRLVSKDGMKARSQLIDNISYFQSKLRSYGLEKSFISSKSAIQSCIIPGNTTVKKISQAIQAKGYDVRPILYPTVPKSGERLRFSIHAFNTKEEIDEVLLDLSEYLSP